MKKTKIATVFLISVLALAGIGITYSGFTDIISIYGTVDTAKVTISVLDYSGTDVWKVWMNEGVPEVPFDNEVFIWHGYIDHRPTETDVLSLTSADHAQLVAHAWAKEGTMQGDITFDVDMVWDNIFPGIDFTANVIAFYEGSIPGKIALPTIVWHQGEEDLSQFLDMTVHKINRIDNEWVVGDEVTIWPFQIHFEEYLVFTVNIHIDQINNLQKKHGTFSFNIDVIQWNDECKKENIPPVAVINGPYSGNPGDTITFDGSGSYDPDGTIVLYEWDFTGDGTYDYTSTDTGIAYHTYDSVGIYDVTLRVTDDRGGVSTDVTSVTIVEPQAIVSFIPSSDPVKVGDEFTIDVRIHADLMIGGWEISELVFSSDLIEITNVVPGSFWTSFFDAGVIDNSAGTIAFIQTWSMGPYPDDSHIACTLHCTALQEGMCSLTISDMDIADTDGNLLTNIKIQPQTVTIN
jgi:hypothetical protein